MNTNVNSSLFDKMPEHNRPDVILVRKVHQKGFNDGASVATDTTSGITQNLEELELE